MLSPSFQDPLRASQASAAAVLTIPSPTSSPWAALPSLWPHLWPSPATPCITAVKTKTLQRPLRPPRPCMTRSPSVPSGAPLDWPTNRSQNQYTKTSTVLALLPLFVPLILFSVHPYMNGRTLSHPSRLLLTVLPTEETCSPCWIHWDCNTCTPEMHCGYHLSPPSSTCISVPALPFLCLFFVNVSWWPRSVSSHPSFPKNQLVARYQHQSVPTPLHPRPLH